MVSGSQVAADPEPPLSPNTGMPSGSGTRPEAYPGTGLLLVIILAFAYHLWSKRVRVVLGCYVFDGTYLYLPFRLCSSRR